LTCLPFSEVIAFVAQRQIVVNFCFEKFDVVVNYFYYNLNKVKKLYSAGDKTSDNVIKEREND